LAFLFISSSSSSLTDLDSIQGKFSLSLFYVSSYLRHCSNSVNFQSNVTKPNNAIDLQQWKFYVVEVNSS
jgi:hypothetical protein